MPVGLGFSGSHDPADIRPNIGMLFVGVLFVGMRPVWEVRRR